MKKNVLRKEFFVEIRKTLGRFISIFFIVALGVAFYSGIRSSEPDMRYSGDVFFDRTNLEDIKVMGTMGLTEDDVTAISQIDGVEYAEGIYSKDVLCSVEGTEKVIHIMEQPEKFNETEVSEGRMPEKTDECLADEDFLKKYHLKKNRRETDENCKNLVYQNPDDSVYRYLFVSAFLESDVCV